MNTSIFSRSHAVSGRLLLGLALAAGLLGGGPAAYAKVFPPLKTVSYVDVPTYMGRWYEIARAFAPYEEGCVGTTATYTLNADGTVGVQNLCYYETFEGEEVLALGVATVADPNTNAKLTVSFPPAAAPTPAVGVTAQGQDSATRPTGRTPYFVGNYWVIDLGPDYSYAVVSDPTRTSFWILSRTSTLDDATLQSIIVFLEANGFDTSKLLFTDQTP